MKHHGVVTKTSRPPARSSRSSADQLASSMSVTLNNPASKSSAGFWNQYQAFLNTSAERADDPMDGNQGENEMARSSKSPVRSQSEPRIPEDAEEESGEGS